MCRVGESGAIMSEFADLIVLFTLIAKGLGFWMAQKPVNMEVFGALQRMIEWAWDQVLPFLWKREPNVAWWEVLSVYGISLPKSAR